MSRYVLDCCALLNLYCGWGGLNELHAFGDYWSIGAIALGEAKYVRELQADGTIRRDDISPEGVLAISPIALLPLEHDEERASFVEFATEIDDGEAEALTLACHRQLILVTDDRLARRMANGVAVTTTSTAAILREWAGGDDMRVRRLPGIVRRISQLACYQPQKDSDELGWWQQVLGEP